MSDTTVHSGSLFNYCFIAMPLAFAGLPLYIHAPDLYTSHYGLGIGLIGAILLFIRLFDAIQDPVIGFLSDKFSHHRLLIIYLGAVLLGLGMLGLFGMSPSEQYTAWWFAVYLVLATTGFSIVSINLNVIGGFWVEHTHERTRITTTREGLALLGLLLASALPSLMSQFVTVGQSYHYLTITFLTLLLISLVLFRAFMRGLPQDHKLLSPEGKAHWALLSVISGNHKRYFLTCFLSYLAAALPAVLVLFFIRDYLQAESLTPLFLVSYFIAGAAVMPLWYALSKQIGKAQAWVLSMLMAVVTFIWAFTLQPGDVVAFTLICLFSGCALGADLALPPSILADRIEKQHQPESTQYFALLALIPKVAIALATGCAFLYLDQLSFVPGEQNSAQALSGLIMLYAIVPCLIKLISAYVLWRDIHFQGGFHANQTSY